MSITLQKRSISIPVLDGPFMVCILHRGRWHETSVNKPYIDVVGMAEDAFRRSGLPVQIRDANETILFEANDSDSWDDRMEPQPALTESLNDTRSW